MIASQRIDRIAAPVERIAHRRAVTTHVRIASPLPTDTFFPVYIALILWAGLYLREPRLRALVPFRS